MAQTCAAATSVSELKNLLSETETSEDDDDDEANEEESDSEDGGCEESGLGLLARFAASALPVSSAPLSLLHDGKHHSRRQSTLGKNTADTNVLCADKDFCGQS